jgi:hypothetical protein
MSAVASFHVAIVSPEKPCIFFLLTISLSSLYLFYLYVECRYTSAGPGIPWR